MVRNFSHDQKLLSRRSTHFTIPDLPSMFSLPSVLMLNVHLVCSILTLNSGNEGYLANDCYGMMIMKGNIKKMNSKSENSDFWLKHGFKVYDIHHFLMDHNVSCLPPKALHNHCLRFLLGRLLYPGEWLCKILGGKQRALWSM